MERYKLISQAERLWLALDIEHMTAKAFFDVSRTLRVERIREQAWWRLMRRLNMTRRPRRREL